LKARGFVTARKSKAAAAEYSMARSSGNAAGAFALLLVAGVLAAGRRAASPR
jgi:hypothetical protein